MPVCELCGNDYDKAFEILLAGFAGDRIRQVAEVDGRGARQRQHEGRKRQG